MPNFESNAQKDLEGRIIDLIAFNSEDRLIAFKPQTEMGIGLVIKKRSDYTEKPVGTVNKAVSKIKKITGLAEREKIAKELFLYAFNLERALASEKFLKDIKIDNFKQTENLYFIFCDYNEIKREMPKFICYLSFSDFKKIAENNEQKDDKSLKFESFLDKNKQDKFSKFLIDKNKLADSLLDLLQKK